MNRLSRRTDKTGLAVVVIFIIYAVIIVGGLGGYVQNIYKLTQCDFEAPYKAEVIRAVGVFPPVGAIVGWIDFGK